MNDIPHITRAWRCETITSQLLVTATYNEVTEFHQSSGYGQKRKIGSLSLFNQLSACHLHDSASSAPHFQGRRERGKKILRYSGAKFHTRNSGEDVKGYLPFPTRKRRLPGKVWHETSVPACSDNLVSRWLCAPAAVSRVDSAQQEL